MTITTQYTLFDLIQAVSEYAASENEVVATVTDLINSGKVQLIGSLTGAQIDIAS